MLPDRLYRLLTAYVDGELRTHQHKAVLRLLRRSSEARVLLRQLQGDADGLRSLPRRTIGQDLSGQVLERIAPRSLQPARHAALTRMPALPVWLSMATATAAAVLLMVSVGLYFYFAAATRKEAPPNVTPGTLARSDLDEKHKPELPRVAPKEVARSPFIGPLKPKETDKPRATRETLLVREQLPEPRPESTEVPSEILAAELASREIVFLEPEIKVAFIVAFRDLAQEKPRQELQEVLRKRRVHRIDLTCRETAVAIERLRGAFRDQGIGFLIDQDAQAWLNLRLKKPMEYVLYTENVTPTDMLAILQQLRRQDSNTPGSHPAPAQFVGLVVNAITDGDHTRLSKLLGVDPTQQEVGKPKTPLGVDIHKPLASETEKQVAQALTGQGGTPRPETGKPAAVPAERLAVVVVNRNRPRPASPEVKQFLNSRKETRSGTFKLLLVLRGTKS